MSCAEEIWKPIEETHGFYEVSNRGRVRSLDRDVDSRPGWKQRKIGKVLKPRPDTDGYPSVNLCVDNKARAKRIHRLVAQHFLPPSDLPEVNHKNLDKTDNVYTNLEWVSHKGNIEHAVANGLFTARHNPKRAQKLTTELVSEIKAARATGLSYVQLGKKFKISDVTAWKVVRGYTWKD